MFEQICRSSLHTCAPRIRFNDVLVIEAKQGDALHASSITFPPAGKRGPEQGGSALGLERKSWSAGTLEPGPSKLMVLRSPPSSSRKLNLAPPPGAHCRG